MPAMNSSGLPENVHREIVEAVEAGNKIEAIKIHREATGAMLKESKEFVDALARGETPPVSAGGSARPAAASSGDIPEEIQRRIVGAIEAGRKIEAVRIYREATGSGLKESKEFVDQLARSVKAASSGSGGKVEASHPHAQSTGCGSSVFVLGLLGLGAGILLTL